MRSWSAQKSETIWFERRRLILIHIHAKCSCFYANGWDMKTKVCLSGITQGYQYSRTNTYLKWPFPTKNGCSQLATSLCWTSRRNSSVSFGRKVWRQVARGGAVHNKLERDPKETESYLHSARERGERRDLFRIQNFSLYLYNPCCIENRRRRDKDRNQLLPLILKCLKVHALFRTVRLNSSFEQTAHVKID